MKRIESLTARRHRRNPTFWTLKFSTTRLDITAGDVLAVLAFFGFGCGMFALLAWFVS